MSERKCQIENYKSVIDEELEKEQMNSNTAQWKTCKTKQQANTLSSELSYLQSNYNQSENRFVDRDTCNDSSNK